MDILDVKDTVSSNVSLVGASMTTWSPSTLQPALLPSMLTPVTSMSTASSLTWLSAFSTIIVSVPLILCSFESISSVMS